MRDVIGLEPPKGTRVSVEHKEGTSAESGIVHGYRFNLMRGRREVALILDGTENVLTFLPLSDYRLKRELELVFEL